MFAFKSTAVLAALVVSALALPAPDAGAQPFTKQNGEDALALNAKFTSLSADSACTDGDQACVGGKFAQCTGGKFALTPCAGGTQCVALPLVNKPGTSITCDTVADMNARIAATGASGAAPAAGAADAASSPAAADPAPASSAAAPAAPAASSAASPAASGGAAPGAKSFTLQNGKDAQALNAKFAGLTPDSACTSGENACINNQFAQCVNSKFVLSPCAGGLQCAALPLVNSAGTSITCVDQPQALQRIKDTGAGSSLTGK